MSWLHNNILLPFCQPEQHRGLGRRLRELERFDALPRQQQSDVQARRVRAILDHAYETSPYYRRVFDEIGFRSVDWSAGQPIPVPELTRDLLRTNLEDVCSRIFPPEQLRKAFTGGTTAPPITLWRDLEGLRNKTALQYHLNRYSEYDQGTRVLRIWGAERDLEDHPSWRWRFYEEKLLGRVNCGAGQLSDASFRSFLGKLNRHQPEILYGYSSTLALFADWLRASGSPWHQPRLVIATAETLTNEQRLILEQTFACEVTVHYGSRDVGMVAAECPEGRRLHFHPWACYVELLPAGMSPAGALYRLVITDLLNYGMPLIRYDTGDCVLFDESPCLCGSWYPSVTAVLGRATDNLVLPDGSLMASAPLIARAGRTFRTIRQVQLVQRAIDQFHLRFSSLGEASAADQELTAFLSDVEDAFRIPLQWTIERVPEIPRERSGKMRVAICEVPRQQYAKEWRGISQP
ncbi:MAG TPA: hypothetical protein VIY53_16145 [Acidobacteriaceae bacterium]